jgi:hypothetical protein
MRARKEDKHSFVSSLDMQTPLFGAVVSQLADALPVPNFAPSPPPTTSPKSYRLECG